MQEAVAIVGKLTNVQAVSLLKQLNRKIFQAVPFTDVKAKMAFDIDGVTSLEQLDLKTKKQNLNPDESVAQTRNILLAFAKQDALAPLVIQCWREIKDDDSMFIETIVALGLLANLTLFMATSEIEFKMGNLTIKKGKADPETVKNVMAPLTELIKKLSFGS